MKHYYKIFTKKLANHLCQQGFQLQSTVINNEKPWLYVYLFEDTEALRQEVAQWQREK